MPVKLGFSISTIVLAVLFGVVASAGTITPLKPIKLTPAPTPTPTIDAGKLFLNRCSSCHGASGQGGEGPALAGVNIKPQQVKFIVNHGVPGDMPSFATKLKPTEIDALATYVSQMKKP